MGRTGAGRLDAAAHQKKGAINVPKDGKITRSESIASPSL
jgi:hypothetical protein